MREAEPASNILEDETGRTDPAIVISYSNATSVPVSLYPAMLLEFFFPVTYVLKNRYIAKDKHV
jgi:hypothetical protein